MPCNAIATATARVSNIEMMRLINMSQAAELLEAMLSSQGYQVTEVRATSDGIQMKLGTIPVIISRDGKVETFWGNDNQLAPEVAGMMETIAAVQFQARILDEIATIPLPIIEADTTEEGALYVATQLNGLDARIIVMPDGEVSVFTYEGAFREGAAGIQQLFQSLSASVTFQTIPEPEQHRHVHEHGQLAHVHYGN